MKKYTIPYGLVLTPLRAEAILKQIADAGLGEDLTVDFRNVALLNLDAAKVLLKGLPKATLVGACRHTQEVIGKAWQSGDTL